MYQVCVLSSKRDKAIAIASALRSQNLHSMPWDINTRLENLGAQAYLIDLSNVAELSKLPSEIFSLPCVLLCKEDLEIDGKYKFDRMYKPPYLFSTIAMYIKYLIFSHQSTFPENLVQVSDLIIDLDTREVKYCDRSLSLSHKEFCLLEFFMRHPGKALTRNQILDSVWDHNSNLFTNTVDVHVGRLRRKINSNMPEKFIKTLHGFGYLFKANPE